MAAPALNQTNFTAGELSEEAYGRTDINKYPNGAKTLRNIIVQVLGGAKGRGGFRFKAETQDSTKRSRLIPFIFSREQAYMLEVGDGYMRVYKDGEQVEDPGSPGDPYEITSPYTEAMLFAMDYVQGADTMFLAHEDVPINRLRRFDHDDWRLEEVPFENQPSAEIGHRPDTTLTLSSAAVGTGVTATAGASAFFPADVGRTIIAGGGTALISSRTSATVVVVEITSAFTGTLFASSEWKMAGTPKAPLTPSETGPVGAMIELQLGAASTSGSTVSVTQVLGRRFPDGVIRATAKAAAHGFTAGQQIVLSGFTPGSWNASYQVLSATTDYFSFVIPSLYSAPSVLGSVGLDTSAGVGGWRDDDVDSYVKINGGIVKIDTVSTSTLALGTVLVELSSDIQAQIDSWELQQPAWNETDGYPRTVTLHAQRLAVAGSSGFPQTVWFSEIGNVLNMLRNTDDDSGFAYAMDSREVNPIAFLPSNRILMALTYGGEFTITGGQEKPINPSNPQIEQHSQFGCALLRPVLIGKQLFFVQRDGKVLRAASYQFETNQFVASDVSKLSKHLMEPGIVDLAYQQHPYSCIWMVREDGKLNSVTIDSEENVIAWTWHDTDGEFESVACIPGTDGSDQVWVIVKRTIDGQEKRYVEMLDDTVYTDSCVTGTNGSPTDTWTGLDHLEGCEVHVRGDGAYAGTATVSGGEIVLNREYTSIEVGLDYLPTIKLLTPEYQGPTGSIQGKQMRVVRAQVYVLDTTSAKINGDNVPTRRFDTDETLDNPPPNFTGILDLPTLGWNKGVAETEIQRSVPGPFYVLSVVRRLEVNQ